MSLPLQEYKRVWKVIKDYQKILITSHENPDGDALGSSLSLYSALVRQGKTVDVVISGDIASKYQYLHFIEKIKSQFSGTDLIVRINTRGQGIETVNQQFDGSHLQLNIRPIKGSFSHQDVTLKQADPQYDLIVIVDVSSLEQLGDVYEKHQDFFNKTPIVNIDHHKSNDYFGTFNLVNHKASAAVEVVGALLESSEVNIDQAMATALLTGIISDTGSFQHESTTENSFDLTAKLMEKGADHQLIVDYLYRVKEVSTLKLWGLILQQVQYDKTKKIAYSKLTLQDLKDSGALVHQAEAALNDFIATIPDVDIYLLFYEYDHDQVRVSIRTSKKYDASSLADLFGGGGHRSSAGFRLKSQSGIESAIDKVLNRFQKTLSDFNGNSPAKQSYQHSDSLVSVTMSPQEIVDKLGQLVKKDQ